MLREGARRLLLLPQVIACAQAMVWCVCVTGRHRFLRVMMRADAVALSALLQQAADARHVQAHRDVLGYVVVETPCVGIVPSLFE